MAHRRCRLLEAVREKLPAGTKLLDFGCGTGDIAYACCCAGYYVEGIDQSGRMVDRARARFKDSGICFNHLDCDDSEWRLPYAVEQFDGVIASSVLEYVVDLEGCLAELRRVCRAGGWMFLTVPNPWHPIRWFESVANGALSVGREHLPDRVKGYLEYLTVSTNRFFVRRWKRLLRSSGWECREVRGRAHPLALLIARAV